MTKDTIRAKMFELLTNGHPIHANGYEGTDFEIKDGLVVNKMTGRTPAILHGNGQTPMGWIYGIGK